MVTDISHLTGVGTTVTLNPATAKALTSLGVKVAPVGLAKANAAGTAVTFPISSGYAEIHSNHSFKPGWILGSVDHRGGLEFSAGGKSLTVSDFTVDPGNSMLYATVDGSPTAKQVPILFLNGAKVAVSMSGSDVVLNGTVAELTQTAATALDQTFGTTAVKAGLPLGSVHLVASGTARTYNETTDKTTDITRVMGDSTSVALNPNTAKALTSLGVTVGTYGKATFTAATSEIHFPITGGMVVVHTDKSAQPGYIDGVLLHQTSGMTLTSKSGTKVVISDFEVDPGNSILYGTVDNTQPEVAIANLDGSAVQVTPEGSTVHLDGTKVNLTAGAAAALDKAFGTTAITPGLNLGTAHIVVSTAS